MAAFVRHALLLSCICTIHGQEQVLTVDASSADCPEGNETTCAARAAALLQTPHAAVLAALQEEPTEESLLEEDHEDGSEEDDKHNLDQ
eukprot:CAMPEP_0197638594 /NCGR_PEP_ID=MMETSP1338-20131121/13483_1 /TAXON_ID=43686 ORGANISM="Pelagodinium beii, Strain RCC1491" /NCGR_SAMPLE_ID=MMETSP1338 /ASSEMBLY_ACC=CAM_ASM_000754 /LENGTH=88 /DNA_ID=CAMNT_0043211199 /DNA_START=34 /DNA_END=300 /DNA_ORIENTATION=-